MEGESENQRSKWERGEGTDRPKGGDEFESRSIMGESAREVGAPEHRPDNAPAPTRGPGGEDGDGLSTQGRDEGGAVEVPTSEVGDACDKSDKSKGRDEAEPGMASGELARDVGERRLRLPKQTERGE